MKKLPAYIALIALLCLPTISFSATTWSWWDKVAPVATKAYETVTEAYEIGARSKDALQDASQKLYKAYNTLSQYKDAKFNLQFFLENPNFATDFRDAVTAIREATNAIERVNTNIKTVKGETWQKGLVEEPAMATEEDDYLILDQPKEPTSRTYPANGGWESLDDFDNELE